MIDCIILDGLSSSGIILNSNTFHSFTLCTDGPENRVDKQDLSIEPEGSLRFLDGVGEDSELIEDTRRLDQSLLNDLAEVKEAIMGQAQAMLGLLLEFGARLQQQRDRIEARIAELKPKENQPCNKSNSSDDH